MVNAVNASQPDGFIKTSLFDLTSQKRGQVDTVLDQTSVEIHDVKGSIGAIERVDGPEAFVSRGEKFHLTVGIVGCLGYTGLELVRILSHHPKVEIKFLTVRNPDKSRLDEFLRFFPDLRNITITTIDEASFDDCLVVFFATPHGVAMKHTKKIIDKKFSNKAFINNKDVDLLEKGIYELFEFIPSEEWEIYYNNTNKNMLDILSVDVDKIRNLFLKYRPWYSIELPLRRMENESKIIYSYLKV